MSSIVGLLRPAADHGEHRFRSVRKNNRLLSETISERDWFCRAALLDGKEKGIRLFPVHRIPSMMEMRVLEYLEKEYREKPGRMVICLLSLVVVSLSLA